MQTELQPSAVLDLRFHPHVSYGHLLAVVSSTGSLGVFRLGPESAAAWPRLRHLATSRCADLGNDVLFLQCNWHPVDKELIAVTTSTGHAKMLRLDSEWKIHECVDITITNSLEAWCIAFAPAQGTPEQSEKPLVSVYCGGDDSVLRYTSCSWDPTQKPHLEEPHEAVAVRGRHGAGVTAILALPLLSRTGGRLVLTGSYDDHLRLFSIHDLHGAHGQRRVELLADQDLGGGVWRLDLVDAEAGTGKTTIRVLASCMHAGARVVALELDGGGQGWSCTIVARFEEHQSMNYGADTARLGGERRLRTCVSTSFYDKLLCLWDWQEA